MHNQVFHLATTDSIDRQQLGWLAQQVTVDNPTGQWWRIGDSPGRYVGPNVVGQVIRLVGGTQVATIIPETPSGQTSNPTPGQQATFAYSEASGADASGQATSVTISNSTLDVSISNSSVNANIQSASVALATYEPTVSILTAAFNNALLQNGNSSQKQFQVPATAGTVVKVEHIFLLVPKTTSAAQAFAEVDLLTSGSVLVGVLARVDSVTTGKNQVALPMGLQLQPGDIIRATISNADTVAGAFYVLVYGRQVN